MPCLFLSVAETLTDATTEILFFILPGYCTVHSWIDLPHFMLALDAFPPPASLTACSLPETREAKQAPVNHCLHVLYDFDGTDKIPFMHRKGASVCPFHLRLMLVRLTSCAFMALAFLFPLAYVPAFLL